jgi:hypothetical protein
MEDKTKLWFGWQQLWDLDVPPGQPPRKLLTVDNAVSAGNWSFGVGDGRIWAFSRYDQPRGFAPPKSFDMEKDLRELCFLSRHGHMFVFDGARRVIRVHSGDRTLELPQHRALGAHVPEHSRCYFEMAVSSDKRVWISSGLGLFVWDGLCADTEEDSSLRHVTVRGIPLGAAIFFDIDDNLWFLRYHNLYGHIPFKNLPQ